MSSERVILMSGLEIRAKMIGGATTITGLALVTFIMLIGAEKAVFFASIASLFCCSGIILVFDRDLHRFLGLLMVLVWPALVFVLLSLGVFFL